MSAQLAATVRKELRWSGKVVIHTDSQVILKYILTEEKRLPVFVANRFKQIRALTNPQSWEYVNSNDNPADEGSRGLEVAAFKG